MSIYSARIGKYRHRVTFQEQSVSQDPVTGELTTVWVDVKASIPAEVLTGAGREFLADQSKQSEFAARINVRYFTGLQTHWRIVHDSNLYNIETFETDSTGRRELRIKCTRGVNDGE